MTHEERRIALSEKLHTICDNVYYQPPQNITMKYPAIVYGRSEIENRTANNGVYNQSLFYEVTVIDYDPDSEIVEALSKFVNCRHSSHYVSDGLNHDRFTIYV